MLDGTVFVSNGGSAEGRDIVGSLMLFMGTAIAGNTGSRFWLFSFSTRLPRVAGESG